MIQYFPGTISFVLALVLAYPVQEAVGSDSAFCKPPLWAKEAIWYQIFPERFKNGDPSNDPQRDDLIGSWPHEVAAAWQVSKWSGDWYALQSWERKDRKGFYFHVQQRRYGGDLQGVIDELDYLSDLGINAIYFNPLFESPSLHKYDARFYHHIDKNFGPDPQGDKRIWLKENSADPSTWQWTSADKLFLKLIQEAHRRNIKIIIDGVFNHTGMTFWAFEDVKKNQRGSTYQEWYTIKQWDNPATQQDEFEYEGWSGVRELPELKEDENGPVQSAQRYIQAIVHRWMDPNGDGNPEDGVDGWRLDVADKMSFSFWRNFRIWVRAINPNAYLVGEVWWEDWKNEKMFNAAPWLQGDVFDAVMNYRWAREALRFVAGKKAKIRPIEFDRRLAELRRDYPSDVNYVLMNLYDSHDTDRLASRIVNPNLSYDKNTGVSDNRSYKVRKPNASELRTQKLMAVFQMTYIGAPMIYYGTEAGMWGADDPDCRKPMLWPDKHYDAESSHPFGQKRRPDANVFNRDLFEFYRKLVSIRKGQPVLNHGDIRTLIADDTSDVYSFLRSYGEKHIIVVLNNSETRRRSTIPLGLGATQSVWEDLLGGFRFTASNDSLKVEVAAKNGLILAPVN